MTELIEPGPNSKKHVDVNPLLKIALELGPLVVFFVANNGFDIFAATAAFMVAIAISLAVSWIIMRTLPIMPVITGIVVLIFGGLTLYLQDELFIKLKPTIVNALFGAILLGGLLFGKSLLGYVFDAVFKLNDEGWRILTFRWGLFFLFLAIVNEVVWRNFSTDFWVSFKIFGVMPITMIFGMFQMPMLTKYPPDETPESKDETIA